MSDRRLISIGLPIAAVVVAAWSLIPFAVWWDGADPAYFAADWRTWGSLVTALGVALVVAVSGERSASLVLGAWRRVMSIPAGIFAAATAVVLAALSILATLYVFAGNPRNVDGFAQLFQARIFMAGRLWVPPPAELASFGTLQMILGPDRWYSQYPPGQSLVLAVGLAAGAWWILNPLITVCLALATYRVARWCVGDSAARMTLMLMCVSPFVIAIAGSEMSHLGAAALGLGAAAAATLATDRGSSRFAALAGLMLGIMTAFRPLDAVAAAAPVALILAWSAPRTRLLACAAFGGVLGTVPTLWYNARTTGSWHTFGYTVLWGPGHSLGFHDVPFGTPLTPLRAIARSGLDLHQLNLYLLDSTLPVLLIVAAGYVAGRRLLESRDTLPFAGAGALGLVLFFYWHRDVFYGPRFIYSAAPWFVMLLGRALVLMRRSTQHRAGLAASAYAIATIAVGLVTITPDRVQAFRSSTPVFALHPGQDAQRARITHAVVVIPDGWQTRLITRMWQLNVPVRHSTRLYAAIDACTLEQTLGRAEADSAARRRLPPTLDSLAALGRPGQRAGATDDRNLRLPPGPLPDVCLQEITIDRRGYYQFAPFLYLNRASLDGDVVWARDLGPGNRALFARYAGRRFYRYAPSRPGGPPVFLPVEAAGW